MSKLKHLASALIVVGFAVLVLGISSYRGGINATGDGGSFSGGGGRSAGFTELGRYELAIGAALLAMGLLARSNSRQ